MDTLKELDSKLPLVSIGLPTFNRPIKLKQTIQCLVNQEYSNIEIIISNNNSTKPEVEKILTDIGKRYSNLRVFHQKRNIGPIENYKFVLSKAKGKYFMWAADDDLFEPNYVSSCIEYLEKNSDCILCTSNAIQYINDSKVEKTKYSCKTMGINQLSRIKYTISHTRKSCFAIYGLIRSDILRKCRFSTFIGGDALIIIQLASFGEFNQLNLDSYKYYFHTNSEMPNLSSSKSDWLRMNNYRFIPFILKNENLVSFLIFSSYLIKLRNVSLRKKISISSYLFKSLVKPNKFVSRIQNLFFYFKKRSLLVFNSESKRIVNNELVNHNWEHNKYFDSKNYLNDITFFANTIYTKYSHIVITKRNLETDEEKLISKMLKKTKFYNARVSLRLNKEDIEIIPLRVYIKFDDSLKTNIKKIKFSY